MSLRALFQTVAFILVSCLVLCAGCGGRSDLDQNIPDDAGTFDVTRPPACNAITCPTGCCDASHVCQSGGGTSACGSMGQACKDCVAAGFNSCDLAMHACKTNVGQCSATSCSGGCCSGNVCFNGNDPMMCGSGGQACASCASSGLSCVGQQCVPPPPLPCGPMTCNGCCVGTQLCLPGTAQASCGYRGAQCVNCSTQMGPAPQVCVANGYGGTCLAQPPPPCGPASCPSGCCDATGNCQPGTGARICGTGGSACQNCGPLGDVCTNQRCAPPVADAAACNAQTCPAGCCDGLGNCLMSGSSTQCGLGGVACQNCAQLGEQCSKGQCAFVPDAGTCNAQTCPMGCCDPFGMCSSGVSSAACGTRGNSCKTCPPGSLCSGQQCAAVFDGGGCNAQTCPTGCCDQFGICQAGFLGSVCGNFGGACQNCSSSGSQCIGQQCFAPFDAGRCSSQTCFNGCCDAFGNCQTGFVDTQCGDFGNTCQNCAQFGQQCNSQQCSFPVPKCNQQTCPFGCCDMSDTCQPGSVNAACGNFSDFCQICSPAFGEQCVGQQCMFGVDAGVCSATTCPNGCCDNSGLCEQGLTGLSCGTLGANCANCLQNGDICSTKQQCVPPAGSDAGPVCNQQTCPFGCCDASGMCQQGFFSNQCGNNGSLCTDCTKQGGQCLFGQFCSTPDGGTPCSQSCSGCCDGTGNCQGGFLNTQCGEQGTTCEDCTMLKPASTCDVNVFPRVCASEQTQCPAPYPSCPSPLEQAAPTRQNVCSTADLQNAAAACAGGASTNTCNNFFGSVNTPCSNCLQPFDVDFVAQTGIRACVAPYVDATCNHNSACIADCTAESCYGCPDSTTTSLCDVQVQSGTCSTYTQADQCVVTALAGPAAVCNPVTYQGNFGAWLQGVGAKYCGP